MTGSGRIQPVASSLCIIQKYFNTIEKNKPLFAAYLKVRKINKNYKLKQIRKKCNK